MVTLLTGHTATGQLSDTVLTMPGGGMALLQCTLIGAFLAIVAAGGEIELDFNLHLCYLSPGLRHDHGVLAGEGLPGGQGPQQPGRPQQCVLLQA